MSFNRRTDHLVASIELFHQVYADPDLFRPVDRPDLDRAIALGTWHAIHAGMGADMMGQKDARDRLSTPEEKEKAAQRARLRARR